MLQFRISSKELSQKAHIRRKNWVFFLMLFMFICVSIKAQETEIEKVLTGNITHHLVAYGTGSRAIIHVKLPKKVKKWGYVFATGDGTKDVCNIDINAGIVRIKSMTISSGSDNCKIYVMDKEGSDIFKKDGKDFFYLESGSITTAASNGIQLPLPRELDTIYIGIVNANVIQALDVYIEVFAVHEK